MRRPLVIALVAAAAFAPPHATASTPRIRLIAGPSPAQSRAITDFRFHATRRVGDLRRPVSGARISFGGAHARTDLHGRATIRLRLSTGRYRARACKPGLRCGVAYVDVIPHGA